MRRYNYKYQKGTIRQLTKEQYDDDHNGNARVTKVGSLIVVTRLSVDVEYPYQVTCPTNGAELIMSTAEIEQESEAYTLFTPSNIEHFTGGSPNLTNENLSRLFYRKEGSAPESWLFELINDTRKRLRNAVTSVKRLNENYEEGYHGLIEVRLEECFWREVLLVAESCV